MLLNISILRRLSLLIVVFCIYTGCSSHLREPTTWPKYRYETNLPCSVRLESQSWLGAKGSGVIVHSSKERGTYILTNRHVAEVIARDQDFLAIFPDKERSKLLRVEVEPFFPSTENLLEQSMDESNEALEKENGRLQKEIEQCELEIKQQQETDKNLTEQYKKLEKQASTNSKALESLRGRRQELRKQRTASITQYSKLVLKLANTPFDDIYDLALVKIKSESQFHTSAWPTQFPLSKRNHYFLAMAPRDIPMEVKLKSYESIRRDDFLGMRGALLVDSEYASIPGNSGSGVFNKAHQLSGVVAWATTEDGYRCTGVVPFSVIMKWLIANKLDWVAEESVQGWKRFQETAQ